MNDAELLESAASAVREERRRRAHEGRLERYVEGEIDAADVAEAARREGADEDLEAELQAFAPLDVTARARIATAILERNKGVSRVSSGRRPSARFRRVTLAAGAVALAASLFFVVRSQGPQPLPGYEISFVGGEQAWRGDAPSAAPSSFEEHRFARGEHVRLLVRPRTAVRGAVQARLFLRRGEDVRAWPTAPSAIDVSDAGAVRVVASQDTLPPGVDGEWEVIVAIGRPDALLEPTELRADIAAQRGFQLVTTRVRFAR